MLSNVGHTIQKMINNTPIAITSNDTTTSVVTNGGNVYQSGLIGNKIQHSFHEVMANENIVGRVVDAKATDDEVYFLNASGSVFEYDYNAGSCSPVVREVYSPAVCCGDKAVKIDTGRAHVLILTECNKVWGAGNNEEYQLVPQGQCKYDTAVEVIVTDTNLHDNDCCSSFTGIYNELECPIIPNKEPECNKISCVKDCVCDAHLGYVNITGVTLTPNGSVGTLSVPVFGDLSYVGFLCADKKGCASGTVTYTITKLYIKCGCFQAKFTVTDNDGCHVRQINVSSTTEILLFAGESCQPAKSELCCKSGNAPITGTAQLNGKCGSCAVINLDVPQDLALPTATFDAGCKTIVLTLGNVASSLAVLCDGAITALAENHVIDITLDTEVPLNCCEKPCSTQRNEEVKLPQPCWGNIFAGHDISVLVDNCNRLYVFGSLHKARSNKDLLKKSCLEELLDRANASISFPADQLNCKRSVKNDNCNCNKCRDRPFRTDLNKFGIHLNFPNGDECSGNGMNVCEFLDNLKRCNDEPTCEPTCEPCDDYVYLNISGKCGCPCGAPSSAPIGSVTLFNKRSICKLVSQGCPDLVTVSVDCDTVVEFDLNRYCIDATDITLDKIVKLDFCNDGPDVNLYIDLDQPGGIKFSTNEKKCNVEFTVNASSQSHQFLLNFGSILDPVQLTNLKYALSLDSFFPCPRFKNPFDTKITNTYLKRGDQVRFVVSNPKNIRQAVTADIPTVFRLNRRIVDVGVGYNNLSVLVGGLACPNEIYVIGNNCHGELGLGTNESTVCWKQVNRCIFDCQVNHIFSGKYVTFYVTQSHHVYAAGQWKCLVNSTLPCVVKSICQAWKIKDISVSKNQLVFLGSDGCIFGLGDNSLGELGLCHLDCVAKPTPLDFFYRLNNNAARCLSDGLAHPMERNFKKFSKPSRHHDSDSNERSSRHHDSDDHEKSRCGSCRSDPCECNVVRYRKYSHSGSQKKYLPNGRLCGARYGKY